jgi:hypothetical protein
VEVNGAVKDVVIRHRVFSLFPGESIESPRLVLKSLRHAAISDPPLASLVLHPRKV